MSTAIVHQPSVTDRPPLPFPVFNSSLTFQMACRQL